MMAIGISIVSVGITLGFKVNYGGSIIATVKDAAVFDDAKSIAVNSIESSNADKAIKTPKFKMTLTVTNKLDNVLTLADAIIENTSDILEGSALIVNGECVVYGETAELKAKLEARRTAFDIAGAQNNSVFTDKVEIKDGYYLKSEIADTDGIEYTVNSLNVKTVSVVTNEIEIPFSKKTVKTSTEVLGYSKVTTAGQNGLTRKTENIEAVNGAEVARTVVSQETVKEAVAQVTTVGTAISKASAAQRSEERSSGFIFPMPKGSWRVSSYYGDGRNHKGVDLCAKKGTSIYAVSGGKVISSGYDGAYGYAVVIEHSNGLRTRYAHASALCVSRGQTVSQGDVIALVGSTGQSTGNHLHFEVIKNGVKVNPAGYIGL